MGKGETMKTYKITRLEQTQEEVTYLVKANNKKSALKKLENDDGEVTYINSEIYDRESTLKEVIEVKK